MDFYQMQETRPDPNAHVYAGEPRAKGGRGNHRKFERLYGTVVVHDAADGGVAERFGGENEQGLG